MRTRHSLTAAVVALVAILVGIVLSLLAGRGPNAHAEGPGPGPGVVRPASPPAPDPGRHDTRTSGKTGGPKAHGRATSAGPARTRERSGPSTATVRAPKPPRLGTASAPKGATYDVSGDGRAFTTVYSSLESGTDIGRLSRTQSLTLPVTGDAGDTTLTLVLQGYVLTGDDTTATLTVTLNGAATTRAYHAGTDRSFTEGVDVPLRGVRGCRITVRVEVDGADGYLNASSLDGQLG
jgi:hypothetical protein